MVTTDPVRSERSMIGALRAWAKVTDPEARAARSAAARAKRWENLANKVDPEHELSDKERQRVAKRLMRKHMRRIASERGAKARKAS